MRKYISIVTIIAVTTILIIVISRMLGVEGSIIPAAIMSAILPVLYLFNKNNY